MAIFKTARSATIRNDWQKVWKLYQLAPVSPIHAFVISFFLGCGEKPEIGLHNFMYEWYILAMVPLLYFYSRIYFSLMNHDTSPCGKTLQKPAAPPSVCFCEVQLVFLHPCIAATAYAEQNIGEFNNARERRRSLFWYLSIFLMCKAWHQSNESPSALASLNSPQNLTKLHFTITEPTTSLCTDDRNG